MLIGEEKWKELDDEGHTLSTLFEDVINETHNFDMDATLQKNVSHIANVSGLDLIPSSLKMIDVQDRLATIPQGKFFSNNPTEIIKKLLSQLSITTSMFLLIALQTWA